MPLNKIERRKTTLLLLAVLVLEATFVVSLRTLGWLGTGSAIQLVACVFVTVLPLLVACVMLVTNRLRFGLRSLLVAITLVAVFLTVSFMPILDHRSARRASTRLLSARATINEGMDWDEFYAQMGLDPPPAIASTNTVSVPPWLTSFTKRTSAIPTDSAVRSIWLSTDYQCQILAENWQRFPSLRSVSIMGGVSEEGFTSLRTTLPRFQNLDCVHTNDVFVPPNWYGCLTNIRTLWVWGEGASRGKQFPREHLTDIASLPDLEVFMVVGYAFNDADARELTTSTSIKRVILRGTAVTPAGESDLSNGALDRVVYRN